MSDSTAICRDWIAKHTRIATHYCRTHRLDASVPMHKASQHMQNTKAQHHQRRDQVTWNVPLRAQFENISTLKRRRPHPPRKQANFSPQRKLHLPEKTQCFVEILTFKSHPWFVKTQLSREPSFEFHELKRWKRSFRARLPSNSTLLNSTQLNSTQLYSA